MTLPSGRLRARKISPFGAMRMTRAPVMPVTNGATEKPGMVFSVAFSGLGITLETLRADGVASGAGSASTVILRVTPGASVCQSPKAALPVRTSSARADVANIATSEQVVFNVTRVMVPPRYRW
jgi:hypothetical protein